MPFSVTDFRDIDLMMRLGEEGSDGIKAKDLVGLLGGMKDEDARHIGSRLAWMHRYGMLDFDPKRKLWSLSGSGGRVVDSKILAAQRVQIEAVPDESLVEVMAHITTRFRHGDAMTAHLLRREFAFGTSPKRRF